MSKIAIVYGSSTGTTKLVAEKLSSALGGAALIDASEATVEQLAPFSFLIFGASTTGTGDLQDDWETLLPSVSKMNLKDKKIALFALGDSASFPSSFAGAMEHLYKSLKGKVEIVGAVSTEGYNYDESNAVIDGKFVGLALDEDNEYNKTDARIEKWVAELKPQIS